MNKTELIHAVAERTELTQAAAAQAVNAFFDTVTETLANGESIALIGFGTFEVRNRAERSGLNPRTGEKVTIAAAKVPAFKAGKRLKESVNQ